MWGLLCGEAPSVTTDDGTTIGYLAGEMAQTLQKRWRLEQQPAVLKCPAQLCGGEDGESIGVVLDFDALHVLVESPR